jgi:hypothetical protein
MNRELDLREASAKLAEAQRLIEPHRNRNLRLFDSRYFIEWAQVRIDRVIAEDYGDPETETELRMAHGDR